MELVVNFTLNNEALEADFDVSEINNFDALFQIDAAGTTWGSIDGTLSNQTDLQNALNLKANQSELDITNNTVTENYNTLNGRINDNAQGISDINTTLSGYGNIVTHNVSEFATSAQGILADSALQPNDNISELINNVGYATESFVNNGLAEKQDILTAGNNVQIVNNTISATDTTYTAGQGISIVNGTISNTQTSAEWGNIQGTLSNQIDLQNALNAKYNASNPSGYQANVIEAIEVNGITEIVTNKTVNISVPTTATEIGALPSDTTIEDLTTTAQQNALNSGATVTNIGQITTNQNNISDIQNLIPNAATSSNQLADKSFVNSSIATNTANFIGTFNSVAELEAYTGTLTNNDYAFVETTDSAGNTLYDRYKYTDATNPPSWQFEYELNNSSFTANQWAAINSGITDTEVAQIATNTSDIATKQDIINDLSTIRSGASLGATSLQPNDNITELNNNAGYITGISWGGITGVLSNQTDLNNALNEKMTFVIGSLPEATADDVDKVIYQVNGANEVRSYKGYASEYEEEEWAEAVLQESEPTLGGMDFDLAVFKEVYQMEYGEKSDEWFAEAFEMNPTFTLAKEGNQSVIYWNAYSDVTPLNDNIYSAFTFYDEDWEEEVPIDDIESAAWEIYYYPGSTYTEYHWSLLKILNATTSWGNIQGSINSQTDLKNALNSKADTTAIPTATSDLINDSGYITGITSSDVTTALGYTPYNSSNPSGYISSVPTATTSSLGLVQPDGTTITINNGVISGASSVVIDNLSITENSSDELQTVGVIDQNNTTNAIKTWTGTKAQYNAIVNKDANTLYNITDDTDTTLTLLETLYPVGSIYITTADTCPLSTLISGSTWQLVSSGRVLQGADSEHSAGTTVEAGLPNITGTLSAGDNGSNTYYAFYNPHGTGCFAPSGNTVSPNPNCFLTGASNGSNAKLAELDASYSSSIYGNSSTVQPSAYVVNIFRRTL